MPTADWKIWKAGTPSRHLDFKSAFRNQQSEIEWLTRPGSQQLGAKWVEVNGGVRGGQSQERANLKRGQQHPLRESLQSGSVSTEFYPTCFLKFREQPGSVSHSLKQKPDVSRRRLIWFVLTLDF